MNANTRESLIPSNSTGLETAGLNSRGGPCECRRGGHGGPPLQPKRVVRHPWERRTPVRPNRRFASFHVRGGRPPCLPSLCSWPRGAAPTTQKGGSAPHASAAKSTLCLISGGQAPVPALDVPGGRPYNPKGWFGTLGAPHASAAKSTLCLMFVGAGSRDLQRVATGGRPYNEGGSAPWERRTPGQIDALPHFIVGAGPRACPRYVLARPGRFTGGRPYNPKGWFGTLGAPHASADQVRRSVAVQGQGGHLQPKRVGSAARREWGGFSVPALVMFAGRPRGAVQPRVVRWERRTPVRPNRRFASFHVRGGGPPCLPSLCSCKARAATGGRPYNSENDER